MTYGIRWIEFNRQDRMVTKEKFFSTEKARNNFAKKLEAKDNFYQVGAVHN